MKKSYKPRKLSIKLFPGILKAAMTTAALSLILAGMAAADDNRHKRSSKVAIDNVQIGADNNSAANPVVQPQDPALAGGGRDQSLQFGDIQIGSIWDDLLIGRLGIDVQWGGFGNDVLIGGTEHFNPFNRDRAMGGPGKDIFVWSPGDGSDFFDGGRGLDAVVFGLIGEIEDGQVVFRVSNDQQAGDIDLDPKTHLPQVNVSGSPGFCEVIDASTSTEAAEELAELGVEHLIRFSLRGVRNDFEAGIQDEDNGLRVTLHLRNVEILVCTDRDGGNIEVLDLTQSPPHPIEAGDIKKTSLRKRLEAMVF